MPLLLLSRIRSRSLRPKPELTENGLASRHWFPQRMQMQIYKISWLFTFSKINLLKSTINTSAFYKQEYDLSDFLESIYVKFSYQSHAHLITQKIRTLMSKTASKENEQQVNLVTRSLY